ncbi:MAG: redox-sensing transcriptional repressor Rex [Meiothermus ruber]|jgi:redox-sensing transcriptional repressor|uniref:Redox-sensing transcriptional repressor Rex n=1 Tax=Meiothermus ruber TaxID=277 RepID=A0A7C3HZJ8_MEIRU|nr:redox-sensing transcriptional repressor Rex [Meiothermus sp.]MCX8088753.1 redox-sensing transcriptional repressor Rex [Meiothermus ruber]GIW26916.1 MAG: redox-sensing transcriptional repressor Rex [Meiothermus sp.]
MAKVPSAAISRLVTYLRILEDLEARGINRTSSEQLAEEAQVTAFQVRKDLSYFGSYGTRGVGYTVQVLRRELRQILGLNRRWGLCIVGMGRLGQAIADYPGFSEIFELKGLFDRDPSKVTTTFRGLQVESMDNLPRAVAERRIDFGLLAVPADSAQAVADRLVESGIKGILNFAPAVLEVPKEVAVENVDFLAGLSRLSFFVLNPKWREEMIG